MKRRKLRVLLRHRGAVAGLAILVLIVLGSLGVTLLSPHDPSRVTQGVGAEDPSWTHWLGTDTFGRDILTRLARAAWLSLFIGLAAVGSSAVVGTLIGSIAGFFGGVVDGITMRVIDVMMAFPRILLAILIAAVLGTGIQAVIIAVGITGIPAFARQIRGSVMSIRENEFVTASRALGSGRWRTMFVHVIPNAMGPIVVFTTLGIGTAILEAAGLSFLGLGVEPDRPEWGAMLFQGRGHFELSPWLAVFSGSAITLTVLAFNLFGDGLRDALDPRASR